MKTLNEEIARIHSEVAEIASKAFTGKSIQERVDEAFAEISSQEYEARERVQDALYAKRRALQDKLQKINLQIETVEKIICQPITKGLTKCT